MPKIFCHRRQVTPATVDVNGHLNNVVYVQWMQDVAVQHSDAQGLDRQRYRELQATWVVRTHTIHYLRPAFVDQAIELQTWVADLKRSTSLRRYRFVHAAERVVLAEAETNWVYFDLRRGRPATIPAEVRDAFELADENDLPA